MIELCLLIYKRWPRFNIILNDLKNQTMKDFKLNVWNNSQQALDCKDFPIEKVNIIESKENTGSAARFKLAKQTTGTPIIFIDDDLILSDTFVEYNYQQYLKWGGDHVLGWYTRIFIQENYWESDTRAPYGSETDYIGTAGLIMDRKIIDEEPLLQNIPEEYCKVEDLYLSYLARMKYGMTLRSIEKRCGILADEFDQYLKLRLYKQTAFELLRKEGWKLLKDG